MHGVGVKSHSLNVFLKAIFLKRIVFSASLVHAHDLNMVPKITHYRQWGKGKKRALQFSKSGDKKLEEVYSRHYVWNQSSEKKPTIIERAKPEQGAGDGLGKAVPFLKNSI